MTEGSQPLPFLSIVMPSFNEEAYIETCIRSIFAQDYPRDRVEILVADGMSTDRTREILQRLSEEDPRVRVIDNPRRIQSPGMNAAILASKGDVIVRMDVHAEYATDYLKQCVAVLEETKADNVGGAQRARANTWFQKALCAALESPLGVGGAKYRSAESEGFVDTVFMGAFRRKVFETVGLFDANAITNEDAELNQRLLASGGKVYLSKKIVVHYFPCDSFAKLAKQYFKYGNDRARTLLKHGTFLSPRPAIPFLMVTGGAALVVTSPFQPFTAPLFGLYALATGLEAVRVGRSAGISAIPIVWAIFPVLHASHGVGFAAGLLKYGLNPDWDSEAKPLDARPHANETNGVHANGFAPRTT